MRITVITPLFPTADQPFRGLPIYQTLLELKELATVNVICPVAKYPRMLQRKSYVTSTPPADFQPGGLHTAYVEYPLLPLVTRGLNGFTAAKRIMAATSETKPDLILSYWLYPEGFASIMVGSRLKVPVIVGSRGSDLLRIPGAVTRYFTRETLRRADYVLTVSKDLHRQAIELGADPSRLRSILNGCDVQIFRPADKNAARESLGLDADGKVIVFVGRLDWRKGLRELLAASVVLKKTFPSLRVAIVGFGPISDEITQLAHKLGLEENIILPGGKDPKSVANWIAAADACCLPSYSEGCPNFVLEALACGRPIVATTVGGTPEIVDGECGILVPPRDEHQLATALLDVLKRDWSYEEISRRAQRSWSKVAQETLEVCQSLLER